MKLTIALINFTLCALQTQSQPADALKNTMPLQVSIETIRAYTNRAEFDLSIPGSNVAPLKLSQFTLANLLRAGRFAETNEQTWRVRESGMIEEPPSAEMDFAVLIAPGKTNRVRIVTQPIVRLPKKGVASNLNGLPALLQYELSREVGAVNESTGRFSWITCKGVGMAKVLWNGSEK